MAASRRRTPFLTHLCSGGTEYSVDFGAVLPVNMQSTDSNVIQIGYWYKRGTGYHFIYSNDGQGNIKKLDDWVGGPPQWDHHYRFKITVSGTNYADASFCVRDLTEGTAYQCRVTTSPIGLPNFIWYGTEINDWNTPLGVTLGDGYTNIRYMQYNPVGSQGWTVASPTSCEHSVEHTSRPWKTDNWACYTGDYAYDNDQMQVVTIP